MPFTLAHSAVVLPLATWARERGLLAALVIGTMAPDFGYFFPWRSVHAHTHTPASLLWFSLPMGLAVWALFQLLLKRSLVDLAPPAWREHLQSKAARQPRSGVAHLAEVGLSLLLGAGTHWLLDAFTHGDGSGARHISFLRSVQLELWGQSFTGAQCLQHTLTLLGMLSLTWALTRWSRRLPPSTEPWARGKIAAVGCLVAVPVLTASAGFVVYVGNYPPRYAVGHAVVGGLGASALALLLWGLLWTGWQRFRSSEDPVH